MVKPRSLCIAAGIASVAGLVGAGSFGGVLGAAYFGCGLLFSALDLWSMWFGVRLLGRLAAPGIEDRKSAFGAVAIVMAFLIKVPLLMIVQSALQSAPPVARPCFLSGLGLVYFALFGWAALCANRSA